MAAEEWEFHYAVPRPPTGVHVELSAEEAEQLLMKRVADPKEDRQDALWELGRFYCAVKRFDAALDCLRQLMACTGDVENKASFILAMGQTMEQANHYEAAVKFYRQAFALEPTRTQTWYFINNNLGFCLNTLGRPEEGETFCRAAIRINPGLPNGHKNLGLSLAAQNRFREAACSFVEATQANASDDRSVRLLRRMLQDHPELRAEFGTALQCCEEAARFAQEANRRAGAAN